RSRRRSNGHTASISRLLNAESLTVAVRNAISIYSSSILMGTKPLFRHSCGINQWFGEKALSLKNRRARQANKHIIPELRAYHLDHGEAAMRLSFVQAVSHKRQRFHIQ